MKTPRKSIRVFEHDRELLVKLYRRRRIPVDQYENRPTDLRSLHDEWCKQTGRNDTSDELLHYMRSQRKMGKWVRLGSDHEPIPALADFSAEETEILVGIYSETVTPLELGSDELGYDPALAQTLANLFAEATGRIVPAPDIIAKLTALRKRGLLTKVGKRGKEKESDRDHKVDGFDDIEAVS